MKLDAQSLRKMIEIEYARRAGEKLGWRLLASPLSTIADAEVVFLGLNPGGSAEDPSHGELSCENGSAYEVESWVGHAAGSAPLQRQVRALFRMLAVPADKVLAGNLVPFRSRNAQKLHDARDAVRFGTDLWSQLLAAAPRRIVIGMGKEAQRMLFEQFAVVRTKALRAGWGNQLIRYGQAGSTRVIGLPHLSRFAIIDRTHGRASAEARSKSEDSLRQALFG